MAWLPQTPGRSLGARHCSRPFSGRNEASARAGRGERGCFRLLSTCGGNAWRAQEPGTTLEEGTDLSGGHLTHSSASVQRKGQSARGKWRSLTEDMPPALAMRAKDPGWFLASWINGTAMTTLELKAVKFTAKEAALG